MTSQEKRVKKEIRRLKRIIDEGGVSDRRQKTLEGVIQNAAVMRVSLDDVVKEIVDADIVVEYDNGGGQTGVRENPLFNAYEKLFAKYLAAMTVILDSLPAEAAAEALPPEEERPKTMLELIREKRSS